MLAVLALFYVLLLLCVRDMQGLIGVLLGPLAVLLDAFQLFGSDVPKSAGILLSYLVLLLGVLAPFRWPSRGKAVVGITSLVVLLLWNLAAITSAG